MAAEVLGAEELPMEIRVAGGPQFPQDGDVFARWKTRNAGV
jgi:hypothetical protein